MHWLQKNLSQPSPQKNQISLHLQLLKQIYVLDGLAVELAGLWLEVTGRVVHVAVT